MKTYFGRYQAHHTWVWYTVDDAPDQFHLPCIPITNEKRLPFDWGYGYKSKEAAIAPAPAALAYSLLHDAFGPELAGKYWLRFLKVFVSKLECEKPWAVTKADLCDIIATMKGRLIE